MVGVAVADDEGREAIDAERRETLGDGRVGRPGIDQHRRARRWLEQRRAALADVEHPHPQIGSGKRSRRRGERHRRERGRRQHAAGDCHRRGTTRAAHSETSTPPDQAQHERGPGHEHGADGCQLRTPELELGLGPARAP